MGKFDKFIREEMEDAGWTYTDGTYKRNDSPEKENLSNDPEKKDKHDKPSGN